MTTPPTLHPPAPPPPTALNLNLVADSGTSFSQPHTLTRSLVLNVADGSLARSSSGSVGEKLVKQVAHGVLMLLAFVVFMPTGALMARHKWVMGDKAVSRGAGGNSKTKRDCHTPPPFARGCSWG